MTEKSDRIDSSQITHLCQLARLTLSPAEERQLSEDLSRILVFVTVVDTQISDLETAQTSPIDLIQSRPDQVRPGLTQTQALANTSAAAHGFFTVPPVLNTDGNVED